MPTVETVTVLITDLVGSTGLAARIGPVAADDLRREHFATLRKAIESCGGKEVKNIGDGLMIVFAGAANAVECAVAIQQAVERRNRGTLEQLAIREGVALGDVTCEDGDYFGMPVVQAAPPTWRPLLPTRRRPPPGWPPRCVDHMCRCPRKVLTAW